MSKSNFILLTGMPGCGKTTLIKKVVDELKKSKVANVVGFYTDEVRDESGNRIGFDIHLLNGKSGVLARVGSKGEEKVGKYSVFVDDFEKLCIPYLQSFQGPGYLIIDEIGKMELFSRRFRQFIDGCFKLPTDSKLITTVPLKSSDPIAVRLKKSPKLFHVTKGNRDSIFDEIIQAVKN